MLKCPVTVATDENGGAAGTLELRATKHGWPQKFFLLNNHQGILTWGRDESAVGAGANTAHPGAAIEGAVRVQQTRGGHAGAEMTVSDVEGGAVEALSGFAVLKLRGKSESLITPTPREHALIVALCQVSKSMQPRTQSAQWTFLRCGVPAM